MAEVKQQWYIIAYDVSEPTTLRRVRQTIEGHGSPLQKSVFKVKTTKRGIAKLRWELEKIIDDGDRLMVVPVCKRCFEKTITIGKKWHDHNQTFAIFDADE